MSTSYLTGAARFRYAAVGAPVNMCRLVLLLALVYIQVKASSESPPRVASCRIIYKSKEDDIFTIPAAWGTCEKLVSFKIPDEKTINMTDTRNCENFYQCQGYSCLQCPCPIGQTFNPKTLMCDDSQSACICNNAETTTSTTTSTTAASTGTSQALSTTSPEAAGRIPPTSVPHSSNDQLTGPADRKKDEPSAEVIIITAIVSATFIIIVVIVMAVCLWQKNRRRHRRPDGKVPSVRAEEYSPAGPPSERHVYAEIDENVMSAKHWQHATSQRAPALPNHLPPSFTPHSPCPVHTHSDSGVGSGANSFTEGYPIRHCFHGHFTDTSSPRYIKDSHVASHCCHDDVYRATGGSSISSESQYSTTSQLTSLDSHDMGQPLHHSCRQNYMSQQVYI